MGDAEIGAGIAAAIIATGGLWWFRLVMKGMPGSSKTTRYGIYALIWLAYFVVVMIALRQASPGV